MANSLNSNPIIVDTDFTSWRATQTLNTGSVPGYSFKRQPGIRPYRITLLSNGVTSAALVTVTDPNDSTVLWQAEVAATAGATGTILLDEDWDVQLPAWRDFSVTGVTAAVAKLQIWYRN